VIYNEDKISHYGDALECAPAAYYVLKRIFRRLEINKESVLADYGCGVGRVVCYAARYPFKKVIGIDLYEQFIESAKKNSEKLKMRKAEVELVKADVLDYECDIITHYLFFNPFGKKTMNGVLNNIYESVNRKKRNISLVYFNPVQEELFASQSWLVKKEEKGFKTLGGHIVNYYESI
jgi:precorrin-6B methylase 2